MVRPSTRPPRTDDNPAKMILNEEKISKFLGSGDLKRMLMQHFTHSNMTTEHLVMVTAVEWMRPPLWLIILLGPYAKYRLCRSP